MPIVSKKGGTGKDPFVGNGIFEFFHYSLHMLKDDSWMTIEDVI